MIIKSSFCISFSVHGINNEIKLEFPYPRCQKIRSPRKDVKEDTVIEIENANVEESCWKNLLELILKKRNKIIQENGERNSVIHAFVSCQPL